MITGSQVRMLRAAVDESLQTFAEGCGISHVTLSQIEKDTASPTTKTIDKIHAYADKKGYEFLDNNGVQIKKKYLEYYLGPSGFRDFMDDVYQTMSEYGGEICVYNVDERNWLKFMGEAAYKEHAKRMKEISKPLNFKILIKQDDTFFIASDLAEYRWVEKEFWNQQSQYAYGDKLALIKFEENDVEVIVVPNRDLADGMRSMFKAAWNQAMPAKLREAS